MNLLQGYEFFLVLFKNMEAELKKEVSQLNRGLKIVLSGMLKVQSWEIIMSTRNKDSKLKVEENCGNMSKW